MNGRENSNDIEQSPYDIEITEAESTVAELYQELALDYVAQELDAGRSLEDIDARFSTGTIGQDESNHFFKLVELVAKNTLGYERVGQIVDSVIEKYRDQALEDIKEKTVESVASSFEEKEQALAIAYFRWSLLKQVGIEAINSPLYGHREASYRKGEELLKLLMAECEINNHLFKLYHKGEDPKLQENIREAIENSPAFLEYTAMHYEGLAESFQPNPENLEQAEKTLLEDGTNEYKLQIARDTLASSFTAEYYRSMAQKEREAAKKLRGE